MNSVVSIKDVHLSFASRKVFDGIHLELADRQFIALLGSNGAGKTTLMRLLLGLIEPQSGSVTVLGKNAGMANKDIGYVPQLRSQLGNVRLCGRDFVATAMLGERWGFSLLARQDKKQIDQALHAVGASELARRPLTEMSGGERQRLLLAQALLNRPKLLLLDEPLISLDLNHQNKIIQLVRDIQQEWGITVVFSAHEINPLLPAVDQVLYLGKGQAAMGSVDEVITSPVLSRLYGSEIEVLRHQGRIFVMAGLNEVERQDHVHDA